MKRMDSFISLDLPALIALFLSSICCAYVGSYMVLRKESLLSDAISHSVLPGIVIAFYFTHNRSSPFIFIGAIIAAMSATTLITFLKQRFSLEQSSSTGVVFSIYFALGIVLLESLSASNIDLDVDCVLHGQIETILWAFPDSIKPFSFESFTYLPPEIFHGIITLLAVIIFHILFSQQFIISSFDRDFSVIRGIPVRALDFMYISLCAIVAVASFTIVGSILVIAMMVCPAASARMYTDDARSHIFLSLIFSIFSALLGFFAAIFLPRLFLFENALSIAGTVVVMHGLILFVAIITSPTYGILGRIKRRRLLVEQIAEEDIIGYLYRHYESPIIHNPLSTKDIEVLFYTDLNKKSAFHRLVKSADVNIENDQVILSTRGLQRAIDIISKHRLLEQYFVTHVGVKEDHVHPSAEVLEHVIDDVQHQYLKSTHGQNQHDPHGKPIPK